MTDNSAEREAEKILKAEANKIQAEECPQGEECPVHFRVDEVYFEESSRYARLITYNGDYAVVTEDNHKLNDPAVMLSIILGQARAGLPPRWETSVFLVGDGTIADLANLAIPERRKTLRYFQEHDDWEYIEGVHTTTVEALRSGLLDVSKPALED